MSLLARGPSGLGHDPYAIGGKFEAPSERFDVVVVGAGAAGIAAAARAAGEGASVLIVDENPLSPALIGMDVPLFWGGRADGAVQIPARLEERFLAASPGLEDLYAAGVDVRLRTIAWGAFANGPALNALHGPVIGLADEERSWLCGYDRLIVAAGARDLVLSFEGWDQPGVMGALAMCALIKRYDAFAGRRVAILGTGALAVETGLLALKKGIEVVALVEVRTEPQGDPAALRELAANGATIFLAHAPLSASGGAGGVSKLKLASIGDGVAPVVEIACDTICLAIGQVPAVELLGAMGAPLIYDAGRGGHVPRLSPEAETDIKGVFASGACAGIPPGPEGQDYALDWMKALLAAGGAKVEVCQCEAVSREALLAVRQPTYLGAPSDGMARRSLATLGADGPFNLDQIKRLTRAGMGPCQGRRCREQVALTLSAVSGAPLSTLALTGYRAPVRPLPLGVLADWDEAAAMGRGWDVWFGIPAQWVPYGDIGAEREAMHLAKLAGEGDAS